MLLFFHLAIYAQTDTLFNEIQIESLLEEIKSEDENLGDLISEYLDNPIDLNNATIDELSSLPFLTIEENKIFVNSVLKSRPIDNIDIFIETLPFNSSKRNILKQFITIHKSTGLFYKLVPVIKFRSRIKTNFPKSISEKENKFSGDNFSQYNNLKLIFNDRISFTAITEKDKDEANFLDYKSASLYVKNIFFNKIILGDYNIQFGQGLALWSPYSFGKSSNALLGVEKHPRGIIPNTTANENRFLRGVAITKYFRFFNIRLYASNKSVDASIKDKHFTFYNSGLHRTTKEEQKRDAVTENILGISISSKLMENSKLSVNFFRTKYSYPLLYNISSNSKSIFNLVSIYYNLDFNLLNYSAEWAYDMNNLASINSLYLNISRNLKIINLFRYYPTEYYSPFSNGFGENSGTKGESGYYIGTKWVNKLGTINAYYDLFKFPANLSELDFPRSGSDLMINFVSRKYQGTNFEIKYINENKTVSGFSEETKEDIEKVRNSYRITINFSAYRSKFRSRFEYTSVNFSKIINSEKGFYFYQEVIIKLRKNVKINFRYTYFETDSYLSRLYTYENDIYGSFSVPALYGQGFKWYFLLQYSPFEKSILEMKISQLYKPGVESLYSGDNKISTNNILKFSLQIRTKL